MGIEFEMVIGDNPVISLMEMMEKGYKFEPVDMPRCERKWYYNENGEYVRYDGE